MNYSELQLAAKKLLKMSVLLIGLIIVMIILILSILYLLIILDIGWVQLLHVLI